jgi:hypothetical protein
LKHNERVEAQNGVGKKVAYFIISIGLEVHIDWWKQRKGDNTDYG